MRNVWVISDTHFGHSAMYDFTDDQGNLIRPWAVDAADGDAFMVDAWNAIIHPDDKVYHLGDVAMRRQSIKILESLNGNIILIRGNHDIFKLKDYAPYVKDIRGTTKVESLILSHYPLHPWSLPRWCTLNVHGHLHANVVKKKVWFRYKPDPKYRNVSVEQTNARPVHLDELL